MKNQENEKPWKNIIVVDIDSTRKEVVRIGKPHEFYQKGLTEEELGKQIINDMASLCEGICTLIHVAEGTGIKSSADSLRDCMKHLQDGFADASYIGYIAKEKTSNE